MERTFGWLEQHWRGSLLDSVETVVRFAESLTFKGKQSTVNLVTQTYNTGGKLTQKAMIGEATKRLIDKLLLEKIPLAGIARVADVSEPWLQQYVNAKYEQVPRQVTVSAKRKGSLTIECDEAWSFVGNKGNKQWIWLAIDRGIREIIGVHIGDRSRQGATALWCSLPPVYRQRATCYTDCWDAYQAVLPSQQHRAVGKESGQTNPIERFNCTLSQRVSRLVRKTLSFSKNLENHIGAIWYFVHHYNESLPV